MGYYVCWAATTTYGRFLLPALAPLALSGFVVIMTMSSQWHRLAFALATVVAGLGLNRSAAGMGHEANWLVTTGQDTRDHFLGRPHHTYETPAYSAFLWINQSAPPTARVLLLGETRGTYLERPFLAGTTFDWPPAVEFVDGATDAEEVYRRLRAAGITHVLVNLPFGMQHEHLGRWRRPDRDAPIFAQFFRRHAAQRFWMPQGIGVFELVDAVPPGQARPDIAAAVAWGPHLTQGDSP